MGFELTLAVLAVVFCDFGVARSAGMEALRRQIRDLQLLSEGSGLRPDVQMSTADTLLESESNSGLLWPTVKHDQDVSTRLVCLRSSSRIW
jgi:hypothetical protein